jgi:hypothetical protein
LPTADVTQSTSFKVQFPITKWARLGRSPGAPKWWNLGLEPWILNLAPQSPVFGLQVSRLS